MRLFCGNIMKEIKSFLKLYWVEIVVFLFAVLSFVFSVSINQKLSIEFNMSSEIILILLPTILTILSIVLSLPNELVCGIDMNAFRKLAKKRHYNFLEMLIISIIIFILYSVASILEMVFPIWILSAISIFYTLTFLIQEIPLLLKNKRYIIKIVTQGYKKEKTNDDLKEAIQYLLMKEGMKYVFINLKLEDNAYNKILIEFLLSLQNDFLWKYLENVSEDLKSYNTEYKQINIIEALEKLMGSIEDIINLNSEMNILEIYDSEEHFYHVTRSLFSIHRVLSFFKLENKQNKFAYIFNEIFMNISVHNEKPRVKRFYYKILNAMLINTLSDGELWFIRLLRDYSFRKGMLLGGSTEYFIFISNYLYYLIYLEDGVPKEFKEELSNFINETSDKNDGYVSMTFRQQLQNKLEFLDIDEYSSILTELIFIFESNTDRYFWFNRPSRVSYSSTYEKMFTLKLLLNWWITLVLTDEMYHIYFWDTDTEPSIPELSIENKNLLATILNEKWFKDDELVLDTDLTFFDMFGLKSKIDSYVKSTDIVSTLRDYKNDHLIKNIETELKIHQKSDENLIQYKEILKNSFILAANNIVFNDDTLKLDGMNKTMFSLLCDTKWSDDLIEKYAEQMPASIKNIVYNDFKAYVNENKIFKTIKRYDKETLVNILEFKPDFKFAYIHEYNQDEDNIDLVRKINTIKPIENFHLPRDVFLKKDAIKLRFHYEENDSIVRRLTEDEVNQIIDRDYKQINGLYKYVEGVNGNSSVLLPRENLQAIVSTKFFLSRIVFTYKIEYDNEKILFYQTVSD